MSDENHLRTRAFLASLRDSEVPAVLHLLCCGDCSLNALQTLGRECEEPPDPTSHSAREYSRAFQRLEAARPGILQSLQDRRAEARSLLDDLLHLPAGERLGAVRREERFHEPHLAELILERSQNAQPREPRRAEELARLAYLVAERGAAKATADYAMSLKARACSLLGNALRLQRRFADAEHAFDQAAYVLTGPLDLPERAEFTERLGLLKLDRGRVDEALALLWRAGYLWGEEGDLHRQGMCLAWIGLLYLDHEDVCRALPALKQAYLVMAEGEEPALACRTRLGLALCHAAGSRTITAQRLIEEARQLYPRVKDEAKLLRFQWAEGRIATRAGQFHQAMGLLESVRHKLLSEEQLHDAALVTLDLALLLARVQRAGEIHPLIHELVDNFPDHPAMAGIMVALGAFETIALQGREDLAQARGLAAAYLQRMAKRRPQLEEE